MILLKIDRRGLRMNRDISRWLKGERRIAAFLEGDTLVLKKISVVPPSAYAKRVRERALPLSVINAEVHRARRSRR